MKKVEKTKLRHAIAGYLVTMPHGKYFSLCELWNWVKDATGISYKDCSLRNYLKAFGGVYEGVGNWTKGD